MEPIPVRLAEKLGGLDLKLCDLDETVWDRFPTETIAELAQSVVDRISAYHVRKVFQFRHFPRPPAGTDLGVLAWKTDSPLSASAKASICVPMPWAITRSAIFCRCGRLVRDVWSICSRFGIAAAMAAARGDARHWAIRKSPRPSN